MTIAYVIYMIASIAAIGVYDPEVAHINEDELLWRFVKEQGDSGNTIAQEIMKLKEIDFPHWYA